MKNNIVYQNGYDSVIDGPNKVNSHFSNFSTPESTKEWERGRDDAKKRQKHGRE